MENNNIKNDFSGLINLIKESVLEEKFSGIGIKNYSHFKGFGWVYGKLEKGFIKKPFNLNMTDLSNFCQDLHDNLVSEFADRIKPGYSHSFSGEYQYFMTIGENVMIFFPDEYEFQDWTYRQVQIDNQERRK